jgi:type IV pilus assembly protein PilM
MGILKQKSRSIVGLDIEPGFLAAAELATSESPTLVRVATGTLRPGLFHDGEVVDVEGLADQLKLFFQEWKLPKRVRLGIASQRAVVRVLELPAIEKDAELEAAVRFQAQEELPMPIDQAVIDHRVLERFGEAENPRMRVLVVAVRRDSVEHLLAATRRAGLEPELVDLSAFAIVRALYMPNGGSKDTNGDGNGTGNENGNGVPVAEEETEGAAGDEGANGTIYCYVGGLTNLAIATGTTCIFNRVLPNGVESMAAALAERKGLTLDHSREWLRHVGLERELENVDGEPDIIQETRTVLLSGASRIADEVRLSLEYYRGAVPDAQPVDRVVMSGPGIAIKGFPAMLASELGMEVDPRSLGPIQVSPGALDNADAAQLTVAAGLTLNEVTS